MVKSVIFGLEGFKINEKELDFFLEHKPFGYILFARNIDNPEQVKSLTHSLREISGEDCPILIDQEGGRVARLKPPHWPKYPPMSYFSEIAKNDLAEAKQLLYENFANIAKSLFALGINVNCAPVLDIIVPGAHDIIGDRSFGSDTEIISTLAAVSCNAMLDNSVTPIIKHIPGHGRAKCDSHEDLPVVEALLSELEESDFVPFKRLNNYPWAMTAHIIYNAIDKNNPATLSSEVVEFIRKNIGFKGLLLTDDLSMKALSGDFSERARKSLEAGCDIVLHCNGDMNEMQQVVKGARQVEFDAPKLLQAH